MERDPVCGMNVEPAKTAATRQLEEQGWVRGADGVLVYRASGDRFETEMTVRPGASPAREGQVIADQFGVRYHPAHVSRLLRHLGWTPQKPRVRDQTFPHTACPRL